MVDQPFALLFFIMRSLVVFVILLFRSADCLTASGLVRSPPQLSVNQQGLSDSKMPRTWVPLASTDELDPQRPTPVMFMGQRYVVFASNFTSNDWSVVDDACPHRLAPLSEGRITSKPGTDGNVLQCSYHGWTFDKTGTCISIPQATPTLEAQAMTNKRCHVQNYPVRVHKSLIWAWLWPEDVLTSLINEEDTSSPEYFTTLVPEENLTTYTRDVPYGWETLLENIVDPAHVPFAHSGMQGTRQDAIAINMTKPNEISPSGFDFGFGDRTMGMMREGTGVFRAPYVIQYMADFVNTTKTFNLTAVMTPTKPGWSRIIIYATRFAKIKKLERKPLKLKIFSRLPTWMLHQLSNRFLDSDLAFLHFQEQENPRQDYFMPAPSDRCVSAIRRWVAKYGYQPPLPPPIASRSVLFDRWSQHSEHCKHCSGAFKSMNKWKKQTYLALAASMLLFPKFLLARVVAVACLGWLQALSFFQKSMKDGGFNHYENNK
jgi:phenylpropionate dioxygenase-like ring-hydroxylating dioxygenase large terminal subunit